MNKTTKNAPAPSFALLIKPSGDFLILDWPTGSREHLRTMYKAIGCDMVAPVDITDRLIMWVDDEGILNGRAKNVPAYKIGGMFRPLYQNYHGPAVFTGGLTRDGDTKGLTDRELTALVEAHVNLTVDIPCMRSGDQN
ncbi:DUF3846 domain-containing protein [Streptomyces sp. NPDC056987]|uniref:DUF3846 domain-containing protein n=1 Tax=Streptomyces sp. NPDC056987 TaxID=3345988 RepID=UPI00362A3242